MPYLAFSKPTDSQGIAREIVIGAADIDARALAVSFGIPGAPIKAVRVLAGTGVLRYTDENGNAQVLGDHAPLGADAEFDPLVVRGINGTSNASPSDALTLRVRW